MKKIKTNLYTLHVSTLEDYAVVEYNRIMTRDEKKDLTADIKLKFKNVVYVFFIHYNFLNYIFYII